ncbi:MAG: DNA repair protein RecO [bacterium]|jgi:DNA repair protein RecO (recombination protein O)|nr:DNA repair protein RecO [candidate division KSB1 bacterium]MDH7561149.1 DNA repair protein RecO [bacterium]
MTKILTLYTKAFGKLSLVAKGARSTKSRFWGSLEPPNHVHVVFYRKETHQLQFLSQADIVCPFLRLRSELGRMTLASLVCEWVLRTEVSEAPQPALFALLAETLSALDSAERGLKNVVRSFQMHFLELHGVRPQLERCAQCGAHEVGGPVLLDVEGGRYFCARCRPAAESMSQAAFTLLRWTAQVRPAQAGNVAVPPETGMEVDRALCKLASFHLEPLRDLRALQVLAEIEEGLRRAQTKQETHS